MSPRPPSSPLFPYTTLFRSFVRGVLEGDDELAGPQANKLLGIGRSGEQADRKAEPAHEHPSARSEEHTSKLQSLVDLVCRLLLEKKKCTVYEDEHDMEPGSD